MLKRGGAGFGFFFFPSGRSIPAWQETIPQDGFFYRLELSARAERRLSWRILHEAGMEKLQKDALQASKEIVVKFIEGGRVSPANFSEVFPAVYAVVLRTIMSGADESDAEGATEEQRSRGRTS